MDTSVAELRIPLEGRPVDRLLGERAAELARRERRRDLRRGAVGDPPAHVARPCLPHRRGGAHQRGAPRRGEPHRGHDGAATARRATIEVRDDGRGMPSRAPPRRQRAAVHARPRRDDRRELAIGPGPAAAEHVVRLTLPARPTREDAAHDPHPHRRRPSRDARRPRRRYCAPSPGWSRSDAASSVADLWPALNRTRPDVVVLDYHLPGDDGLVVCRQSSAQLPAPAVLLYSAYADASLTIPARSPASTGSSASRAGVRALRRDPPRRARRTGPAPDIA